MQKHIASETIKAKGLMTNKDSLWRTVSCEIQILRGKTTSRELTSLTKRITMAGLPVQSFSSDTNRRSHAEIKAQVVWVSERRERADVWFVVSICSVRANGGLLLSSVIQKEKQIGMLNKWQISPMFMSRFWSSSGPDNTSWVMNRCGDSSHPAEQKNMLPLKTKTRHLDSWCLLLINTVESEVLQSQQIPSQNWV